MVKYITLTWHGNKANDDCEKILKIRCFEAHIIETNDKGEETLSDNIIKAFIFKQELISKTGISSTLRDTWSGEKCCSCGNNITNYYVLIIDKLKKAGLLNQNYKPICCNCYDQERKVE